MKKAALLKVSGKARTDGRSVLVGIIIAMLVMTDWYLNPLNRPKPLDEGELYRLEIFLDHPKRVLFPPNVSLDGMLLLLGFTAALLFLGAIVAKNIDMELSDWRGSSIKMLNGVGALVVTVLAALKTFPVLYSGCYQLPIAMKLVFITCCYYCLYILVLIPIYFVQRIIFDHLPQPSK